MKLLSLALLVPAATSALDAGNYDHMVEVDAAAGYKVHWKIAGDSINLAVQAKTTGWVGFGIGETTSGSMKGADIVTGSVVAGKGSIVDRFSLAEVMPQADMSQDWTLVASEEANGVTTLEMSRKLKTEDTQDREIGAQIHAVIVAWGSSDDFGYHAGRLATRIDFNNPTKSDPMAAFKADTTKYKTFEIMSNHTMTAEQTVYIDVDRKIFDSACADDDAFWYKISPGLSCSTMLTYARAANATATQPCTTMMTGQNGDLYNVADTGACDKTCGICDEGDVDPGMLAAKKYHIVGIEHIVAKNTEDHVHHFTLSMEGGGYPPTVYAWARGGEAFVPPSECGFLLDPSSGFTTFRLNVHYDNPHRKNTGEVDASGIRVYYTETLRDNDCGVVTLGDPTVVDRNLPKGITRSEYHCSTPDTGFAPMNVFGSFLHMHSVGKRIYTEIWRNGSKLQTTSQIDFWDDGFQLTNPVSAVVKPGDVLKTVCIHNAPQETVYGKASDEEMCMDFMFYYPKMSVDNCGYGGRRTGNSYGKLESNTTLSSDPVWFGTPKGGAECPMINGLFPGGECTLPTGSSTCTDLEAFYTCMAENQCQTECESALAAARNNDANYCPNAACKATTEEEEEEEFVPEEEEEEFVPEELPSGFVFDDSCDPGSGTVEKTVVLGEYSEIGRIPTGKFDLTIELESNVDVDIVLFDLSARTDNNRIVAIVKWCTEQEIVDGIENCGVLGSTATEQTAPYQGMLITYSGYEPAKGPGYEFVRIQGMTTRPLEMGVLPFESGNFTVKYSYAAGCGGIFTGTLTEAQKASRAPFTVGGTIPSGTDRLEMFLNTNSDMDVQLYDASTVFMSGGTADPKGKAIIAYCNNVANANCNLGLVYGQYQESVTYAPPGGDGMSMTYSGWGGFGRPGIEFIIIQGDADGKTTTDLNLAVLPWEGDSFEVVYHYSRPQSAIPSL